MGQIQPLHPVVQDDTIIGGEYPARPVASIVRCELCGAQVPEPSQRLLKIPSTLYMDTISRVTSVMNSKL